MARIFTTPAGETAAKSWMHDVMAIAGITQDQRTANYIYFTRYSNPPTAAATKICDELINRDFTDIDTAIRDLARYRFFPNFTDDDRTKMYKDEDIAKVIVYMAERFGLYWDDTIRTPYEIDEFKKTLLGKAVYTYGRYISAIKDKTTKTRASTSGSGATSTAGSAPQNGYKQSGPQSGNVRGLLGNPGDKVYADTAISYRIEGDKVKSNTPRVFIKPLTPSGAAGNSNKVYISSGNGYTDCTCYFDDPNEAQKFLDKVRIDLHKLINEKRAIAGITNLHVAKVNSDKNGYFLVDTEYGPCAVSAKTLNEAMTEALEEETKQPGGWEKATESYDKEKLDELHTWMRKD